MIDTLPHVLKVHDIGGDGLTVFRILKDNGDESLILESLWSHYESKKPPKPQRENAAIHMGVSTFESVEQARDTALKFPVIGRYIVPLRLTAGNGFAFTDETGRPATRTLA